MSVTTMTNQEDKATTNSAAAAAAEAAGDKSVDTKTELAHWLNKKDERTFSKYYIIYLFDIMMMCVCYVFIYLI